MQKLLDIGIASRRGIMTAHQESAYKHRNEKLSISEDLRDNSILLPLYAQMTDEELNYVIDSLNIICN
jgi:dTDP-4-amino-4,6-dideoxygalactose transaminase